MCLLCYTCTEKLRLSSRSCQCLLAIVVVASVVSYKDVNKMRPPRMRLTTSYRGYKENWGFPTELTCILFGALILL